MNDVQESAVVRRKEGKSGERRRPQANIPRGHGPWNDVLRRGLFETVIVAVGVFLALFVDQWRVRSEERQLADEARAALRSEVLANREAVLLRLRRTSQLYVDVEAHPGQIDQYVFERRNRPLQMTDAAWTMTVQTGAIRWLDPAERARTAELYAGYERMRDIVSQEMVRWTELAAFPPTSASRETHGERDRAIRVWQGFALRSQMAQCVNAGRHERALGAQIGERELTDFCAKRRPEEDPALIYREWRKLGWTSSIPPRIVTENGG